MARTVSNTGNSEVVLNLINSTELQRLFTSLQDRIQIKVLEDALKKSGKVILDAAKSNFNATKKGKSKTNYAGLSRAFKSKALRRDNIGMLFGMQHREGYKYRFLNYGTVARFTRGNRPRFTGTIQPSNFFTDAVTSQAENAQARLSNEIVLSLERLVRRYENTR